LRAELEVVHKHPLGQGSVDGWCAYRVGIHKMEGRNIPAPQRVFTRMIRSLERAWEIFWPPTAG
jgi:hypothetical protein